MRVENIEEMQIVKGIAYLQSSFISIMSFNLTFKAAQYKSIKQIKRRRKNDEKENNLYWIIFWSFLKGVNQIYDNLFVAFW